VEGWNIGVLFPPLEKCHDPCNKRVMD